MAWKDTCPFKGIAGVVICTLFICTKISLKNIYKGIAVVNICPVFICTKIPLKAFILAKVAFIKNTFFLKVAARGLIMS